MKSKLKTCISFNAEERALLDSAMQKDGWENISGFVKYKLFGWEPHEKVKKLIKKKNPDDILILLYNELKALNQKLEFINFRYNKDMNQLWREEGVDAKKWKDATNRAFKLANREIKDVYNSCFQIARELGIEISHQSLAPEKGKPEIVNKEELDKKAKEINEQFQINISQDILPKPY